MRPLPTEPPFLELPNHGNLAQRVKAERAVPVRREPPVLASIFVGHVHGLAHDLAAVHLEAGHKERHAVRRRTEQVSAVSDVERVAASAKPATQVTIVKTS